MCAYSLSIEKSGTIRWAVASPKSTADLPPSSARLVMYSRRKRHSVLPKPTPTARITQTAHALPQEHGVRISISRNITAAPLPCKSSNARQRQSQPRPLRVAHIRNRNELMVCCMSMSYSHSRSPQAIGGKCRSPTMGKSTTFGVPQMRNCVSILHSLRRRAKG